MIVGTFEVQAVTNYKIKPKKTQTNRVFFFVFFFHTAVSRTTTHLWLVYTPPFFV